MIAKGDDDADTTRPPGSDRPSTCIRNRVGDGIPIRDGLDQNGFPEPPPELNDGAAAIWRTVCGRFVFEPHEIALLAVTLSAWTRMDEARCVLDREGTVYVDRFGAPRSRPEVAHERDNRIAFMRGWRELGLDEAVAEAAKSPRPMRIT